MNTRTRSSAPPESARDALDANPPAATRDDARAALVARRRRRWVIGIAATICIASWIALACGLLLGVGFQARLVLATAAALSTEALVWISAAMLGLSLFQARRELWQRIRALPRCLIGQS